MYKFPHKQEYSLDPVEENKKRRKMERVQLK
jgi:hypothetical protein